MRLRFYVFFLLIVLILVFGVVMLIGGRSVASRSFDLAEARMASPYYQALDLHQEMREDDGGGVSWVWVALAVLAMGALVATQLLPHFSALLKEARLTRRAMRQPVAVAPPRVAMGELPTAPRLSLPPGFPEREDTSRS